MRSNQPVPTFTFTHLKGVVEETRHRVVEEVRAAAVVVAFKPGECAHVCLSNFDKVMQSISRN